ncbi:adenylyltransferase/cytidyltransferase family protein [Orbus sturtevantii]|uniref:adenylyltransferase/cytidyltransferase family protein n=1 Tax=Orbus sturtevantii TaxID=3074109 RepID=UPI00370D21D1
MKKVITYGTFDYFHYGHFMLLKRAADLGDSLIVGLSSDEFNTKKNKQSLLSFDKRKEVLESFNFIDLIITENSWEQKIGDIKNHNIDILFMGSDWSMKFDYLKKYCDIVYVPRTPKISTSLIKKIL